VTGPERRGEDARPVFRANAGESALKFLPLPVFVPLLRTHVTLCPECLAPAPDHLVNCPRSWRVLALKRDAVPPALAEHDPRWTA
jgi:hypothetical protein